tara:strand:+ start:367 stop:819 length:453 start_codon:yes stop_codon:yes gene_type:complete
MALTGLTTQNYNFHTFHRHNAMLMMANKEVMENNNSQDFEEFKQIVNMSNTYFDPEYPNIEDPKIIIRLVELRFQHSQLLYKIHLAIHERKKLKTKLYINKFQEIIQRLNELFNEYGESDILDDVEKRKNELDGINEIVDVLNKKKYWLK